MTTAVVHVVHTANCATFLNI